MLIVGSILFTENRSPVFNLQLSLTSLKKCLGPGKHNSRILYASLRRFIYFLGFTSDL